MSIEIERTKITNCVQTSPEQHAYTAWLFVAIAVVTRRVRTVDTFSVRGEWVGDWEGAGGSLGGPQYV